MSILKATGLYLVPALGLAVSAYFCGADRQNLLAPLGVALFAGWMLFSAMLNTELLE